MAGQRDRDRSRVWALLDALAPGTPDLCGAIVDGEPHPQGRPRAHRKTGVLYKLPVDRAAEKVTALRLRHMIGGRPLVGNLAIACLFYRSTLRTCDTDNLIKHVLDAGNKVLWLDDKQITAQACVLELDRAHPRSVVALCRHESTMWRGPKGGNLHQPELLAIEPQLL
jgi:Holliday junction resolvase RusA-like endonuclease